MQPFEKVVPGIRRGVVRLVEDHVIELRRVDASAGAERLQKEADLGKTIVAGSDVQTIVVGSTESAGAATARAAHAQPQRAPTVAPQRPVHVAAPAPKKSPVTMIVLLVVLIVAAVGGYFVYKNVATPQAPTTYIEINGVPWGTVKTVTSAAGKVIEVNQPTPIRVPVSPGEYTVVVTGPNGQEQSEKINVSNDSPGSYTPVFEKIDVDQILQSN